MAEAAEGDLVWRDTFPAAGAGGRPDGWTGSAVWLADGDQDPGALQVSDTSATAYVSASSSDIPVSAGRQLVLTAVARSTSTGTPAILLEEFDDSGTRVATQWLNLLGGTDVWEEFEVAFRAAAAAVRVRLQVYPAGRQGVDKTGVVAIDSITLREGAPLEPEVIDGWGRPVPVTDVVDIAEPLPPEEFWGRVPDAPRDAGTAARSLWSLPLLRRHFFAVDPAIPAAVRRFHAELPVLDHTLGAEVDLADERMRKVVAADIRHRPIVAALPWTTGTYSKTYYPRRTCDHLLDDFLPATSLSTDPALVARRDELLDYMHYSQFQTDGDNGFTQDHDPDWHATAAEAGVTRRWAGGWDYLFDWEWLDAYGYQWQLHEPDHHVGSAMAQALVRAYELTGDRRHLDSAQRFVWHQFPRYGFHSGTWQGRTYYWTEYNPTGPDEPDRDSTDNVVALCAMGAAMVGHHTDDRRLLAWAKGALWYCVREWTTDGRWYYDGAENPLNPRRSVSHEMVVLIQSMITIAYLIKSGVELDRELDVVTEAYEFYLINYAFDPIKKTRYGQLTKLPPADAPRGGEQRLTAYFTANQTARTLTFADPQPGAAGHRGRLRVIADVLSPPDVAGEDWRVEPGRSAEVLASVDELAGGVTLPVATSPADVVRLTVDHQPTRPTAVQPSMIDFTDATGTVRRVTATIPDPDLPITLAEKDFAAVTTRFTFGIGADLDGRIRPA